jgi:serine/threonine protein kinase
MSYGDLYHFLVFKTHPEVELDWNLILKIAMDIASGVMFLHSAKPPIIHRDLKSPNVLLASLSSKASVVAKITDFGLSGAMRTVSNIEVGNPSN